MKGLRKTKTILMVEDDEVTIFVNLRVLCSLMAASHVEIRRNGLEAIEYLIECDLNGLPRPDLILLDVEMPLMCGRGFLEIYSRMPSASLSSNTKVVMMSVLEKSFNEQLCAKYGVASYLEKPLSVPKVLSVLDEWKS